LVYSIAFSSGNPVEKNEMNTSHTGHCATGSFTIVSCGNGSTTISGNDPRRCRICLMGSLFSCSQCCFSIELPTPHTRTKRGEQPFCS